MEQNFEFPSISDQSATAAEVVSHHSSSRPMMGSLGSSSSTVTSAGPYPETGTVYEI